MNTPAPTKYVILTCYFGKYTWWPQLGVVDFVYKRQRKHYQIAALTTKTNNEDKALEAAAEDLIKRLKN